MTKSMGKEVEVVAKRLGVTFVDLHLALSGSGVNLRDALRSDVFFSLQGGLGKVYPKCMSSPTS